MDSIFSKLDNDSLRQARKVSKQWRQLTTSHWIWRQHFERDFYPPPYPAHVDVSSIVEMGTPGIGTKEPQQRWREMYDCRKAVERRWEQGSAAAIYLTGHTDSVYCVQFDQ